nr:bifunctional oligoribonuclease/PAP phosphatase NrnA [Feifania hominis]
MKAADDILLITHRRPDGDTLGSAVALADALRQRGKLVQVVCSDEVTPKYRFLTGGESALRQSIAPRFVVAVDVADESMFGGELARFAGQVDLVIDHHGSNAGYGRRCNLIEPGYAATGELVYELIGELGATLTTEMARALYTAISTDTGCFRFANTTANTHAVAAALMETGFDPGELNYELFMVKSRTRIQVEAAAYKTLRFYHGGRVAGTHITAQQMAALGANEDDVDNLVAIPRAVEGVVIGFSLRECGPDEYKVSVRTNAPVDAARLCMRFGGGGHLRAAGCTLHAPLDEALRLFVEAAGGELAACGE